VNQPILSPRAYQKPARRQFSPPVTLSLIIITLTHSKLCDRSQITQETALSIKPKQRENHSNSI
jgi:hypothetical protein